MPVGANPATEQIFFSFIYTYILHEWKFKSIWTKCVTLAMNKHMCPSVIDHHKCHRSGQKQFQHAFKPPLTSPFFQSKNSTHQLPDPT